MRLGILGGSFNPPHLGHLALARHAREQLRLDRVWLMPANVSPFKRAEADPGAAHRLAMCGLAAAEVPGVAASALEIERGGLSYTVDTLRAIDAETPDAQLTFILGADTARTLPGWHEPAALLDLAELAVAERGGDAREEVFAALAPLAAHARVAFLEMPTVEVSSSTVRERVARGEGVGELVGGAVAAYISEHGLYAAARAGVR